MTKTAKMAKIRLNHFITVSYVKNSLQKDCQLCQPCQNVVNVINAENPCYHWCLSTLSTLPKGFKKRSYGV